MPNEHILLFDEHISYGNLIHRTCPMSDFLSFNERIYNLMNEFCYQKPTILFKHKIIARSLVLFLADFITIAHSSNSGVKPILLCTSSRGVNYSKKKFTGIFLKIVRDIF